MTDERVTIGVDIDASEARRQIDQLSSGQRVELTPAVDTAALRRELSRIDRAMDQVRGKLAVAVSVDDRGEIARLRAELSRLSARRESVQLRVESNASQVAAEIDRAAQDRSTELHVTADTTGVDLSGLLTAVPGLDRLGGALEGAQGTAAGLSGALGATGAAVGPIAAATGAVLGLVAALKGGVAAAQDWSALGREVRILSDVTGAATEDSSRLLAVAQRFGAESGDIADVLLNIQQIAADGSAADIGLSLDPGASAVTNLRLVADAYASAATDAEKARIASTALGEEGARQFVPLLKDGAAAFDELLSSTSDAQIFSPEDIAQAKAFEDASRNLGREFTDFKLAVGAELAPSLTELLLILKEFLPALEGVATVIGGTLSFALDAGKSAARSILEVLDSIIDAADVVLGPTINFADTNFADVFDTAISAAEAQATGSPLSGTAADLDAAALSAAGLGTALGDTTTEAERLSAAAGEIRTALDSALSPLFAAGDAEAQLRDARAALTEFSAARREGGANAPDAIDARGLADDLAQAAQAGVVADIERGILPADEAVDALRNKLQALRSEQVTLGVDPEVTRRLAQLITQLNSVETEADQAAQAAAKAVIRGGGSIAAAERAADRTRGTDVTKVAVSADTREARADIAAVARDRTTTITAEADTAEAVDQIDQIDDRTVTVRVRADGLAAILDQYDRLRDRTVTVRMRGDVTGNWAGGAMAAGEVAEVAEYGPEIWQGRSGRTMMLTGRGLFAAPEPGRVISGAETARRISATAGHIDRRTTVGDITVVSPHPRLAGLDVWRALTRGARG